MTMQVLQSKLQITKARKELVSRGASLVESPLLSFSRRLGLARGIAVGDKVKSWDVLCTLKFIEQHLSRDSAILDIGCYASEVLVALHVLGYSNLAGADLNPNLKNMPFQEHIRYETSDFMHTKFADASFDAITSISVIEHGFDGQSLLNEMARLLKPGGYFMASFDYWPEKIDTTGTKFFGMDWKIFSEQEVEGFINEAQKYGLFPAGEIKYKAKDRPINCGGKRYTFGWLVLRKTI